MALVAIPGLQLPYGPLLGQQPTLTIPNTTQTAIDAAGESAALIGPLYWEDGASHTVSSAGGKIYWLPNSATFADAGTTFRIGIQDVSSGTEDGVFDVHDDLVGGTDTITAGAINTATMSSGTKTIAHTALVAVVLEMTARGGADTISPRRVNQSVAGLPYSTLDTGATPTRNILPLLVMVEADDGAVGWFHQMTVPFITTETSFNSGSAADEYAMLFQVPFKCAVNGILVMVGEIDAGETGTVTLYDDPTVTPSALATYSHDGDTYGIQGTSVGWLWAPFAEQTLDINTDYAMAYAATSAGNRTIGRVTGIPSADARLSTPFGTTLRGGTRANGSGAFSTSTTDWPMMFLIISQLSNDAGSGGGGGIRLAGRGGLAAGA